MITNARFNTRCLALYSTFIGAIYVVMSLSKLGSVEWDGLVFSQQWPITACILHQEEDKGSSCNIYPNMTSWTVHGLWPTKFGERGPNNCNASWAFNETKIANLEPLLMKFWTNIYADTAEDSLWKHEWDKHGTCAAASMLLNSEYKYFSEGLRLTVEYDLVTVFAMKGIFPSDEKKYTLEEIGNAISEFTETSPIIDCSYNKKTKQHELWQVKICLDKHLTLMNCDMFSSIEGIRGNCPASGIIYPSSVVSDGRTFNYTEDLVRAHVETFHKRRCSSFLCNVLKGAMQISMFPFQFIL